jgi:hypothetical protein
MKKVTILFLFSTLCLSVIAQEKQEFKNIIGVSPFQLANGVRIKYERLQNGNFTYGGILTGYYPNPKYHDYSGVQLAPIARYYFKEKAPKGFYAQAKILGGIYSTELEIETYDKPYTPDSERTFIKSEHKRQTFSSFGGGLAIGFQTVWGDRKRLIIDINLGLKYMGDISATLKDNEELFPCNHLEDWYFIGPASIIDGLISIGYRF